MFAHISLTESKAICQDHCLAVLFQSLRDISPRGVKWHHERAVLQIYLLDTEKWYALRHQALGALQIISLAKQQGRFAFIRIFFNLP